MCTSYLITDITYTLMQQNWKIKSRPATNTCQHLSPHVHMYDIYIMENTQTGHCVNYQIIHTLYIHSYNKDIRTRKKVQRHPAIKRLVGFRLSGTLSVRQKNLKIIQCYCLTSNKLKMWKYEHHSLIFGNYTLMLHYTLHISHIKNKLLFNSWSVNKNQI